MKPFTTPIFSPICNSAAPQGAIDWLTLTNRRAKEAKENKEETRPWCRVENITETAADLYIYGAITPFPYFDDEVSAGTVLEQVRDLKVSTINVHINSPGGSVFEGVAIYQILADHAARVEVKIDALCGSIATTIALAGDHVEMADNALFMIHDPSMFAAGTAADLRSAADMLDQVKETIINTYEAKTGQTRDQLAAWMDKETYFTAAEALDAGFIDSIKPLKKPSTTNKIQQNPTNKGEKTPENTPNPSAPNRQKHASDLALASFSALAATCK